jgi:lysophospholipase L1-like esterase
MSCNNKSPLDRAAPFAAVMFVVAFVAPALAPLVGIHPAPAAVAAAAAAPAVTAPAASAPVCSGPAGLAHLNYPLQRTARRIAGGEPLTIVAIGSSSTAGAGASSPAANYPSRLAVELKQRFPGHDITVLNRGINGEVTAQMLARFATDVVAVQPDLVLWQVGTNSVLRDHPLDQHSALLHQGIEQLKTIGADIVLIDMQYAPKVLEKSETASMEDQIALTAKQESVDLFGRFALMRNWHEALHIPFEDFVAPDQLHQNDWSYACVAKLLASAIGEAATRPVASAAAHPGH